MSPREFTINFTTPFDSLNSFFGNPGPLQAAAAAAAAITSGSVAVFYCGLHYSSQHCSLLEAILDFLTIASRSLPWLPRNRW
jgi:hypothetical protein